MGLVKRHGIVPPYGQLHALLTTSKCLGPKFPHASSIKANSLKTYKEATCKNIFIGLKLKINKGNISQAICVSATPLSKKNCSGLHQFPVVEDSFIDQDEQNLSLIVLATDISKDIRRTEQTYNLRQERKGACALVQ